MVVAETRGNDAGLVVGNLGVEKVGEMVVFLVNFSALNIFTPKHQKYLNTCNMAENMLVILT